MLYGCTLFSEVGASDCCGGDGQRLLCGWRPGRCSNGTFGTNCTSNCSCPSQAFNNCDSDTGYCLCKPGFMDILCSKVCPVGRYGSNCTHNCTCQNNSTCDLETGTCNCSSAPGWTGSSCEEECDAGTYGEDCQHNCTCNGNQTCDHVTGNCTCMAGLTGPNCTDECTYFTYGVNCAKNCTCMENTTDSCNKTTGHCTCKAGYMGDACDEVCIPGFYGDACEKNCSNVCMWTNYCHHVFGTCICLGSKGENCSVACGQHEYGLDCNKTCTCTWERTIDDRCDNLTGRCQCREGYSGANCEVLVEVKDTVDVLQDNVCETSGLDVSDDSKPNRNGSEVEEHKAVAITGALSKESDGMSIDIQTEKTLTQTYEEPPDSVEPKHTPDDVEYDSAEYLVDSMREQTETTKLVNGEDEDEYDVHGNQTSITSDKLNEYNTFQDVIDIIRKASIADDASSDEYDMLNSQPTRKKSTHTSAEYSSFEMTKQFSIDENDENSEDDEMYNKLETKQKVAKRIAHPNYNRVKINSELGADYGMTVLNSKPRDASEKSNVLRESQKSKYNQDRKQSSEAGTTKLERIEVSNEEKYNPETQTEELYEECGPEDDDSKP
ncbi:MEGF6-like protein, partial [Mya arenaria]